MTNKATSVMPKLAAAVVLLLIAAVAAGALLFKRSAAPSIDDLLAILPSDAMGFTVLRGLPAVAIEFGKVDGSLFDRDFRDSVDEDVVEALEHVEKTLDVDLSRASGLVEMGLDPTRPGGAAMTLIRTEPVGAVYLPATDPVKLALNLRKLVESDGSPVERETRGTAEVYFTTDGAEMAWTTHGDLVVVAVSAQEKLARRLLEDTVEGRDIGVLEKSWVQALRPLIDDDWQGLVAMNPDLPEELLRELPRDARRLLKEEGVEDFVRDLEGFAGAVDVSPKSVRFKTRIASEEGSDLKFDHAIGALQDAFGKRIPGTALAAGRFAIDIPRAFETLSDEDAIEKEIDETMRELRRDTGIDVEDDLLGYLGSPISFAVFDSERASEIPLGFAAWVPVTPEHKLDRTFEDFEDALSKEGVDVDTDRVGDVEWHSTREADVTLGWAVAKNHLVVVFGKRLLEDISGALEKPKGSYLDKVSPFAENALIQKGQSAAYVDVDEVVRALGSLLEKDRDFKDIAPMLRLVNEVLLTSTSETRAANVQIEFVSDEGFDLDADHGLNLERQRRKKEAWRSAGLSNLDGIRTAEKAYHAEWDAFTSAPWTPRQLPKTEVPFAGGGYRNFDNLGWVTDGETPCRFMAEARNGASSQTDDFLLKAECDADGDGVPARYEANRAERARTLTPSDVY